MRQVSNYSPSLAMSNRLAHALQKVQMSRPSHPHRDNSQIQLEPHHHLKRFQRMI
jgi:hypothetical protein